MKDKCRNFLYRNQSNEQLIFSIFSSIHLKMILDSPNYCPENFELMLQFCTDILFYLTKGQRPLLIIE